MSTGNLKTDIKGQGGSFSYQTQIRKDSKGREGKGDDLLNYLEAISYIPPRP
jgi:hypothetical protein